MKEKSKKVETSKEIVKKELDLEKHEPATLEKKSEGNEKWYVPLSDYYEDTDNYYLHIEMPGVDEGDVEMDVYQDDLIVTGRVKESPPSKEQMIYTEYGVGNYHRHYGLLAGVERSRIKAKIKDGVVTVKIPKKEEFKPRSIPVTAG